MRFFVTLAAALACLGAWTPARAQTSLEAAAQALSEGKAKLVFEAGKKPAAPAGKVTEAKPVEKKDDKGSQEEQRAKIERFKALLKKVDAGEPISQADKDWAVAELTKELKTIESGEVENKIVASLEKKVDQAIADGKIPAEKKPEIMKQVRAEVHAQLEEMAEQTREVIKKIQNAKTK